MSREALRVVHRWSGIVLAIPLLVAGLTGAAISFHHELDRWLAPAQFVVAPRGERLPLDTLLAAIPALGPGAAPGYVRLPRAPDDTAVVDLAEPLVTAAGDTWSTVFLDPYDGRVLGGRDEFGWRVDRLHLMPLLYRLHYTLGAGEIGRWTMGLAAAAWTISGLLGLVLAVPRPGLLRRALSIRRTGKTVALAYDWHRATGVATLVLLAVVAFSGFYLTLPQLVEGPMQAAGLQLEDPRRVLAPSAAHAAGRDIGWAAAVTAAAGAVPGATPFGLALDEERGYYQVRLIEADDVHVRGTRRVMVDAGTGAVVVNWSQLGATPAGMFVGWQFPLHTGQVFGEFGRWLASALSLVTCALVVAGVWLFTLRRARRRAREPRGAVAGTWARWRATRRPSGGA
jgi:uncharacterized iron-regulated membrane protein